MSVVFFLVGGGLGVERPEKKYTRTNHYTRNRKRKRRMENVSRKIMRKMKRTARYFSLVGIGDDVSSDNYEGYSSPGIIVIITFINY